MSKRFRKLLYPLATLGGLLFAAFLVMNTPWFRRVLERRVISNIEDITGARVEVREFRFAPLIFQITLHGLTLHGLEPPSEPPLFSAQSVVVRLNPASPLRQQLALKRLDWDNAVIHLRTEADGTSNLPGPRLSPQGSPFLNELMDLSIGTLILHRTTVSWNDRRLPFELAAENVAVQLHLNRSGRYTGSLSSSETTLKTARWSLPPTTLSGQVEFSRRAIAIPSVDWRSAGLTGHASLSLEALPSPQGYATFQVKGDLADLARSLRMEKLPGGSVVCEGQATYRNGEWASTGQLRGRQLVFSSLPFNPGRMDVSADYRLDRHHLKVSDIVLSVLGGTVRGESEVTLDRTDLGFVLRAQLRGLDVATTLASFPETPQLSSRLGLAAAIQGTISASWQGRTENFNSQFGLEFRPRPGAAAGVTPVSGFARGTASLAGGLCVEFTRVELQTPRTTLTAQGTLGKSESSLGLQATTSDFEEWRPLVEFLVAATEPLSIKLASAATFTGAIGGPASGRAVRGRIKAGAFIYRGWKWDGLEGDVSVTPDSAEISSLHLRSGNSNVVLDVSATLDDWTLARQAPARIAVRAQTTPLEGLQAVLGLSYPLGGLATGRLEIQGTPSNSAGTGFLEVKQPAFARESFDSLSANIRVAESVLNVQDIQLAKGRGKLTGQASFDPAQEVFSVDLHGADFSPADFLSTGQREGLAGPKIDGLADFDLNGHGTPEDFELHSSWNIREFMLEDTPVGRLQGRLDWQSQTLRIQGRTDGPGGTLHFNGEARTEEDWPSQITGEYSDFRADPWIHALLGGKFNALVTAGGSASVAGPLKEPARIEIQSQAQKLAVTVSGLTWTNDQPVDLHYADRQLAIRRFHMRGASTDLEVEGSVRFTDPPTLAFDAQGQADAKLLALMDPAVHATGRSEMKLRVSGSPTQPLLYGTLKVQDLNLNYDDFPFYLSGLNGEIQLEGERATTHSLRGQSGSGSVSLTGSMTFTPIPRFEVQADLDQVRVRYPAEFTSLLTGGLRLAGTSEGGTLAGELTVRQMFASENFNVMTLLQEFSSPSGATIGGVSSSLAPSVRLNVRVSSTPEVRLETHDLRLAADVDLHVQGTLASPVEVGTVHILSGEAVVRGNRFKLNRGDISMAYPFRTRPVVDLEATTRVERYDLTLDVTGPFDQLKIAYRSDPPLSSTDILSLLALGYARQEQGMSTASHGERLQTVGASALLSEALSSQTTGRIQRLFGVSRVKVDPNVGGPTNVAGARITVEQQVTRDLTLTYVTNTATSQQRVIQFEWTLSDNVSLIGVRDPNGILGVELKFRRRFK